MSETFMVEFAKQLIGTAKEDTKHHYILNLNKELGQQSLRALETALLFERTIESIQVDQPGGDIITVTAKVWHDPPIR